MSCRYLFISVDLHFFVRVGFHLLNKEGSNGDDWNDSVDLHFFVGLSFQLLSREGSNGDVWDVPNQSEIEGGGVLDLQQQNTCENPTIQLVQKKYLNL